MKYIQFRCHKLNEYFTSQRIIPAYYYGKIALNKDHWKQSIFCTPKRNEVPLKCVSDNQTYENIPICVISNHRRYYVQNCACKNYVLNGCLRLITWNHLPVDRVPAVQPCLPPPPHLLLKSPMVAYHS